jgi:hypothetical protein
LGEDVKGAGIEIKLLRKERKYWALVTAEVQERARTGLGWA